MNEEKNASKHYPNTMKSIHFFFRVSRGSIIIVQGAVDLEVEILNRKIIRPAHHDEEWPLLILHAISKEVHTILLLRVMSLQDVGNHISPQLPILCNFQQRFSFFYRSSSLFHHPFIQVC